MSLDPQQRLLMENVYQALENGLLLLTAPLLCTSSLMQNHSWHSVGPSNRIEHLCVQQRV